MPQKNKGQSEMNSPDILESMRKEASRIEEDSTYSSKSHFNADVYWSSVNYFLGIPSIVLGILAGVTFVKEDPQLASYLSISAALLTGLMTFLKPNERAEQHKMAGGSFLALKNDARIFREIETIDGSSKENLKERVLSLSNLRNELNQKSPRVPRLAFLAARKGIEEGESNHKVDEGKA